MKEIMEMLKTFGPNYELTFRTNYFGAIPGLRITLVYRDQRLNKLLTHDQEIPFNSVNYLDEHGPEIIEEMFRCIREELRTIWGAVE